MAPNEFGRKANLTFDPLRAPSDRRLRKRMPVWLTMCMPVAVAAIIFVLFWSPNNVAEPDRHSFSLLTTEVVLSRQP